MTDIELHFVRALRIIWKRTRTSACRALLHVVWLGLPRTSWITHRLHVLWIHRLRPGYVAPRGRGWARSPSFPRALRARSPVAGCLRLSPAAYRGSVAALSTAARAAVAASAATAAAGARGSKIVTSTRRCPLELARSC